MQTIKMSEMMKEIGLKGYEVLRLEESKTCKWIELEARQRAESCPRCGSDQLHSKGRYQREVRHLEAFGARVKLSIRCRRYQCLECARSFVQKLPGILPGRHSSEPFREQIYQQHRDGICGRVLAKSAQLGSATVERIYQQFTRRKANERLRDRCPEVLGIDEHTLHKGCRFATTLCDLKNHKIFDVREGKSTASLEAYLLSLSGREQVKMVCIDLSSSYRSLIRRCFPNARIVADRFHVVRIVQYHFMELFRSIAAQIHHQRPILAALRKRPENLTADQRQRLETLFAQYPSLEVLYRKMHALRRLMNRRTQTARQCRRLAPRLLRLISQLKQSGFAPLQTLARTLRSWQEEIACMWRFTKNNGITEGFHRKMKLIQRRAYGFRNFENYRLRVIAECG